MGDDDPDAMWRPGYAGPVVYRRPATAGTSRLGRGRRRLLAGGVVALAAVVTAGVAVVAVRWPTGADGPAALTLPPRVPPELRSRWSVTVDGRVGALIARSDEAVVVALDGSPASLVSLDAASGTEQWRADVPGGEIRSLDVLDDVVVASAVGADRVTTLVGMRADTGTPRWTLSVDRTDHVTVDAGQVLVSGPASTPATDRLDLLDASTGQLAARVTGDAVSWTRAEVQRRVGDRIELVDRRSFRVAGAVDLASLGVAGAADVAAVVTGDGIVVASAAAVTLVDDAGAVRDSLSIIAPADGATRVRIDVLDDTGRYVAVQQGDHLVVLTTTGGELRELWSDSAWMLDWHVDAHRQLVATATVNGSVVAMPPQIVDAATGVRLWDGPAAVQRSSPLRVFGEDGFVTVTGGGKVGTSRVAVVGYDLDRTELWRRPIDDGTTVASVDGGVVTMLRDPSGATTRVTFYS